MNASCLCGVIEKGLPLPERATYGSIVGTLRQMEVGDSAFFRGATVNSINSGARYALGSGNYTLRKLSGGVRVWRTT